ncbi:MAG: hypothetical protein JHC98_01135 [Thermoleophilaceae bacterium]|nr:hypothetical protein [Thermoleophilaceae bacterium]
MLTKRLFLPLVLLLLLALVPSATAATTFGDPFTGTPADFGTDFVLVQVRNPDASEFAGSPASGVITSVTVKVGGPASSVQALFLRPTTPLGATISLQKTAANVTIPVTADAGTHLETVNTRVSAQPGDRIGLSVPAGTMAFTSYSPVPGSPSNFCGYISGLDSQVVGDTAVFTTSACNENMPAVRATIEPDADLDGYGDETQDLCPSDAARQSACLVAPPLAPPNLVISAVKSSAKPRSSATRRFTVTNIGGRIAAPVKIKVVSSKKVKRIKFVKSLLSLAPGASVGFKVKVTPKTATSTRLTVSVSTPGESATADNSASARVKFKLTK